MENTIDNTKTAIQLVDASNTRNPEFNYVWKQIYTDKEGKEIKNIIKMEEMPIEHIEKALSKLQSKKHFIQKQFQTLTDLEVQFTDILEEKGYEVEGGKQTIHSGLVK